MNKNFTITLSFAGVTIASLISLSAINKAISKIAVSKQLINSRNKEIYHWRFGDISYRVTEIGRAHV